MEGGVGCVNNEWGGGGGLELRRNVLIDVWMTSSKLTYEYGSKVTNLI